MTEEQVAWLQEQWEGAYHICMVGDSWAAVRLDDLEVLLAPSGPELRKLMRQDYAERPVLRKDDEHE